MTGLLAEWAVLVAEPSRMVMYALPAWRDVLAAFHQDHRLPVLVVVLGGALLLAALLAGRAVSARWVLAVFAVLWCYLAAGFLFGYLADISLAATPLGVLAIAQGLCLALLAWRSPGGRLARRDVAGTLGTAWLLLSFLLGPVQALGQANLDQVGHFATAPHTLVFATFAVLLLARAWRWPWTWLLVLPGGLLGFIDAVTAWLLGARVLAGAYLALAMTALALAVVTGWRARCGRTRHGGRRATASTRWSGR